ncbi:MAG: pitrilysin family protein [Alphaproteobacteria bacterium]|nr:pitrilysin family protein [Alphaproteobacteria bacterium]
MSGPRLTDLPGGVRLVTEHIPTVESATLGAWFGAGSRNETADINGVAHMLEHMAFKGTASRSAFDIAEQIEAVGGRLDAYTTHEQTAYYARVLKDDATLAVDVIGDILCNSTFSEEELARERSVILQEIGEASDTPDDVVFELLAGTALPDQPLGRPILGLPEIVRSMPRETITGFLDAHYGADRLVFAAAGNIDHDRLEDEVATAFDGLSGRDNRPVEPARYAGGDARSDRDLQQVHLMLGFEAVPVRDPTLPAQQVFSRLLGGSMSSRLFQEIRERRGLAYSIHSFAIAWRDTGLFGIHAATAPDLVGDLVPAVCDELVKLAGESPDDALQTEVGRARSQIRAGVLMSRESTSSRCEALAGNLHAFERVIGVDEIIERFEQVDGDAVQDICRRLLSSTPTLAAVGPVGTLEPWDRLCARLA